jgi:predicted nucleotidyltransferase
MLNKTNRIIAHEFQRRLTAVVPVLDLRVFGSWARGEATPDSDLDVFIEVEELTPELCRCINKVA